jgi:hypothetical protein
MMRVLYLLHTRTRVERYDKDGMFENLVSVFTRRAQGW